MTPGELEAQRKFLRDRGQRLLKADHFEALGLARTSGPSDVEKAFVEAAKIWHPDRLPKGLDDLGSLIGEVYGRIDLARTVLSDPGRRARYLEELARPANAVQISTAEAALDFRKAEVLLKKNDLVAAEAHIRRAVKLAPTNPDYGAVLVSIIAKPDASPERLRELVRDLDRLLAGERPSERALFVRGQLRKRLGLVDEAVKDFARAAELNPNNIDAAREVRVHRMRQERSPDRGGARPTEPAEGGPFGFLKKLFKR
jgi:curved DNA-binding protein CbpA